MADSICDACRAIDFEKVLKVAAGDLRKDRAFSDPTLLLDDDVKRFAEASAADCPLCQLLASTLCATESEWASDPRVLEDASRVPHCLQAFSFLRNCLWGPEDVEGAQDCHILLAPRGGPSSTDTDYSRWASEGQDGYVACLPKKREAGLFVPHIIPDTFDHNKAKLWLQNCRATHGDACNEYYKGISDLKVIDCETLGIVQIEEAARWVALSYVWGHDQPEVSPEEAQPGTLPRVISKTVQHAIEVTKGLGYRYLWVDRYCIDQENEIQKHDLIAKMDMIYRGADLTIVAAAGHDEHFGLPGVGTTQRKKQKVVELDTCTILSTGPDPILEVRRSRWWSRGWTFQEALLSRRRLIFTEHQSWFECHEASWMEAIGGLELLINPDEGIQASKRIGRSLTTWFMSYPHRSMSLGDTDDDKTVARLQQFSTIAKHYSERNLTFDMDSLNAFAGISRYFQRSNPPLAHILGIPFIPSLMSPSGGSQAEKHLFFFLSWFHHADTEPRRRQHFPSWTWAGWAGRVGWMTNILSGGDPFKPKMKHIQFEVDGHLVPQESYYNVFDPVKCSFTESNIILNFQARVVPSSMFWLDDDDETTHDSSDYFSNEENRKPNEGQPTEANDCAQEKDSNEESKESSETLPPDPKDWSNWVVGVHDIWDRSLPPDCGPQAFLENLESGRWDCLLLGDYNGNGGYSHRRFLLVVEWLESGLARRVGCVILNRQYYLDAGTEFFDDSELDWKSVRVV